MAIDSRQFRSALGTFATGITIVTTRDHAGVDVGLTVNSFNSVSLDPPLVLWSLAKKSHSRQAFIDAGYFAVHILAADQSELATRFASPQDRFSGLTLERGDQGMPLLQNCAARFQCKIVSCYEGGDHDIFVGEVRSFEHFNRPALVLHAGRYAVALEKPDTDTEPLNEVGRNSITYLLARAHYQLQVLIRPELARSNLSDADYSILSSLALNSPCTFPELQDIVSVTGYQVTVQDITRLAERNLIGFVGAGGTDYPIQIIEAGKEIVLRIATIAKAAESNAATDLSYTEIEILRRILRKIIRRTKRPWQRDPLVLETPGTRAK